MEKQIVKVLQLEHVRLSMKIFYAWLKLAKNEAERLKGRISNVKEIPDEQFRVFSDGSGQIFVTLPNQSEITLDVSPSDWLELPEN